MTYDIDAARAVVARSDDFYRAGDLLGAIAELSPLIEAQVPYFRPHYNTGFFHWLRAEYDAAVIHLEAAIQLAPNFPDARLLLGKALVATRHFAGGLANLRAYAQMGGADRGALLWEARALWGLNQPEEAARLLLEHAEQIGWPTPKSDGLVFSEEPWFLSHIANWHKHLGPIIGQINQALEIGSMEGMSAVWIAEFLLSTTGRLTLNDIEFRPNLVENLRRSRFGKKIEVRLGDSAVILPQLPDTHYDFIYVDGDHSATGVFRDCVNAAALAAPDAIVILDDYGKANETTRIGIDLFLATAGRVFNIIEQQYQVFLRRNQCQLEITTVDIEKISSIASPNSASALSRLSPADALGALRSGIARFPV